MHKPGVGVDMQRGGIIGIEMQLTAEAIHSLERQCQQVQNAAHDGNHSPTREPRRCVVVAMWSLSREVGRWE